MKIGWCLLLALLVYPLSGCEKKPGTPADVKERAANATEELKQDTKAVAEGIREGWTRDKSQDTRDKSADARDKSLDINAASKEQLESLPGVTPAMAERVVSHRPYAKTSELVEKHILSKAEYDKIADRLTVK